LSSETRGETRHRCGYVEKIVHESGIGESGGHKGGKDHENGGSQAQPVELHETLLFVLACLGSRPTSRDAG
jgi:hypothetical protein